MNARYCETCGAEVPPDGICLKCMLQPGLDGPHLHVRCPHCRNPIELVEESEIADIECPSCGSSFSLLADRTATLHKIEARNIGHFELLEQVGIGAFGSVWKAKDSELERTVAVKIPRSGQLDRTEAEQFLREARSAAQLKHPNIVGVHEIGRDNGQIYIVSDFIEGVPLSSRLTGHPLTFRDAAELCAKIAEALHHAHEAGVIHRDLKPSNVMLDAADEPHVMDFGLAKREAAEITMTVDGKVLGTPAYMSPEQARGQAHAADRRSDVYSLGVILFEMVTGEKPFRGDYRMLLHQVLNDEAPAPRGLKANVPRDLDTICRKCLEKAPDKRYASAQDLADELRRFLGAKPIQARPISRPERIWRWSKRNRLAASLIVAGPLVAAVMFLLFIQARYERNNAERARNEARESEANAIRSRDEATEAHRMAELAQQLAEQRRDESNATVDKYFTMVSENKLLNAPGLQELRRMLLEEAKEHYEGYAEETGNASIRARRAKGKFSLGQIAYEGRNFGEAVQYFRQAMEVQAALQSSDGSYGDSLNGLGRALEGLRRHVDALVSYSQAAIERQRVADLAKREADESTSQRESQFTYVVRQAAAGSSYMNVANTLARLEPSDLNAIPDEIQAFLSDGSSQLGTAAELYSRAIETEEAALAALRSLQREYGDSAEFSAQLGTLLHILGLAHLNRVRIPRRTKAASPEELAEAVAYLEEARQAAPNDLRVQFTLASCYVERGRFKYRTDREGANSDWGEARALLEPLVYLNPNVPRYRFELARLGDLQGRRGYFVAEDSPSVIDDMRAAERIFEQMERRFPGQFLVRLGEVRQQIASYQQRKLERLRDGLQAKEFGPSLELADRLASEYWMDATKLSQIASMLVEGVPDDHLDLTQAMWIAQRANRLQDSPDFVTLSTLARIDYLRGELEKAVANQRSALEHAPDDHWPAMRATLREYETELGTRTLASAEPSAAGTVLSPSTEVLPNSEVDPRVTLRPDLSVYVSVGRTRAKGAILQFDSRGVPLGQVELPSTSYGLARLGNSLLAATPVGAVYRISGDGMVHRWFTSEEDRPLAITVDESAGDVYIGDNISDFVKRFSNTGEVTGQLQIRRAGARMAQNISLAVRTDGVLIGASQPWGVFLVDDLGSELVRENVLLFAGHVAADPSSNRWAATQPDGVRVFELDRQVGFIPIPEERRLYESGGPLVFGPNGELLAGLKAGRGLEIAQVDLEAGEFYPILSLPTSRLRGVKGFTLAPMMKWPIATHSNDRGDTVEVLGFDRRLPTSLRLGATFTAKIAYSLQSADAAEIVVLPRIAGQPANGFVAQGTLVRSGSGSVYTQIRFDQPSYVDEVRVVMRHVGAASRSIAELLLKADVRWRGESTR